MKHSALFTIGVMGTLVIGWPTAIARARATVSAVENAQLTFAPEVPASMIRHKVAIVRVHLDAAVKFMELSAGVKYKFWTFNGHVPGPFIRARVGDTFEVRITNSDHSGMPHNVDFHAVTGPGGGATVTTVTEDEE